MHRQENIIDNGHDSYTNPADKQFTAEFQAGSEIYRYAIEQTLKKDKNPMTEDALELLASIGDEKVETWVKLFIYSGDIIKMINNKELNHGSELTIPQKYRLAAFNHAFKEAINNATDTSLVMEQLIEDITHNFYENSKSPKQIKEREMFRNEVFGACFGMWHELCMQNLLKSAGKEFVEATISEDVNQNIDLKFRDATSGRLVGVDVKSPKQHVGGNLATFHQNGSAVGSVSDPVIKVSKNPTDNNSGRIIMSADYGFDGIPKNLQLAPLTFTNPNAIKTISYACKEAAVLSTPKPQAQMAR